MATKLGPFASFFQKVGSILKNSVTPDVEGTAAAEPTKIQIEFSESETISIEEVQVDPKSNQPATILPNNQVAPAVTTQPKKNEDSDENSTSSGSSDSGSEEDSEEESDEGKCAPSKCCKKRTCGGWGCCILIWFFKILGFILWIAVIALGAKGGGGKKRRRGRGRGKARGGNRYGHKRGMNFGGRR